MLGFLNIDKPAGMTAHDVVYRVRRAFNIKRVGHGGTLDPMATGVLPVAVGKACRLLQFLPGDKTYDAEILLGTTTSTDDIEGKVIEQSEKMPAESDVVAALLSFVGPQAQVPPLVSAVHIDGQRLYKLARDGRAPENIPARQVIVHTIEILAVSLPAVRARISCGSGTYIRSIARDLGEKLGCGGCLKSLRREQAGPFNILDATPLAKLTEAGGAGGAENYLIAPTTVLGLPCLELEEAEVRMIFQGRELAVTAERSGDSVRIAATRKGELVAVCRRGEDNLLKPEVVVIDAV